MEMAEAIQGLKFVAHECYKTAERKGWWKKYDQLKENEPSLFQAFLPEILSTKLMLVDTETAEACEELRAKRNLTEVFYSTQLVSGKTVYGTHAEIKEIMEADGVKGEPKPEGFGIELADGIIRLFDLARWLGINIGECIAIKMSYNEGRSYMHGGKAI